MIVGFPGTLFYVCINRHPGPVEYIFLEVPNCRKAMTSEASLLDNFCYAMRKMPEMEERPKELKGEIFDLLFNSADLAHDKI